MMLKCVSAESWYDAAVGRSDVILMAHRVPRRLTFRVYVGKRSLPSLIDAKTRFKCLGCQRLTRGVYACRVKVKKPKDV